MSARSIILIVASTLTASPLFAANEAPMYSERDHLVPVDPYPGNESNQYTDQIRSRFKLESHFYSQMVVRPSFSGEYAVRLHGGKNDYDINRTDKFFLTYTAADESIWYAMPENNDEKKQKEVTVEVATVEFPKSLAIRIHQLWQRMLLRTRYPEEEHGGVDGTTYEFATWSRYGQTWSPQQRKSPRLFIELGHSLINYCKSAPARRLAAEKEIESRAAKLEAYLNKQTVKRPQAQR